MNILITGGTGFIGRALTAELLNRGHTITVLTRNTTKARRRLPKACEVITTLADYQPSPTIDAIVNLAGEPIANARWTPARKQRLRDSRLGVTQDILAFIARSEKKPGVLVSGSAVGYYGDQRDLPVKEDSEPHTDFSHLLCRDWEQAALGAEALGVRVALVRTGLVIGHSGFLARMLPAFRLGLGGRLGDGQQYMPWIHLDDEVGLICELIFNEHARGAFNATAPHPVTNQAFTRCLGLVLNRPTWFSVPAALLRFALGELSQLLLTGQRALPARATHELYYAYRYPELETALRETLAKRHSRQN